MGIKSAGMVGFVSMYQYSTEIYPTVARTTGTAACVAGGRLGGMLAPLFYEMLEGAYGFEAFFYLIGTCASLTWSSSHSCRSRPSAGPWRTVKSWFRLLIPSPEGTAEPQRTCH